MIENDSVMTHGAELHDKKIHSNIEDTSFFDNKSSEFAVSFAITEFENLTENLPHNLFLSLTISFPISENGFLAV